MEFTHNKIIDEKTRNNEESYNQKFISNNLITLKKNNSTVCKRFIS